jgi:hypothetical protein
MAALVNDKCPKCGGDFTGEGVDVNSATTATQDVTCNNCMATYRHYYTLTDVEEI